MSIDLNLCSCAKCGAVFTKENNSIKGLYREYNNCGHHGQYLDCPICEHKTIIWRDWGINYDFLKERFGEYGKFTDKSEDE
jgi:DNA-directed RNA polymerase subunit RPC12/RpoP